MARVKQLQSKAWKLAQSKPRPFRPAGPVARMVAAPHNWKPAHRRVSSPEPSENDVGGSESGEEDGEDDLRSSIAIESGAEEIEDLGNDSDIASDCGHGPRLEEMDRTIDRLWKNLEDMRDEKDMARDRLERCRRRMAEAHREFVKAEGELQGAHLKVEAVHRELGEARRAQVLLRATHTAC